MRRGRYARGGILVRTSYHRFGDRLLWRRLTRAPTSVALRPLQPLPCLTMQEATWAAPIVGGGSALVKVVGDLWSGAGRRHYPRGEGLWPRCGPQWTGIETSR